jgi:hypothetical protein
MSDLWERQFENSPFVMPRSPVERGSVQVACRVTPERGFRPRTVASAGKAVKNSLISQAVDFED